MEILEPVTDLDARYSDDNAEAIGWTQARETLAAAEIYWLSTVRPDGRPHVTPLLGVWLEPALYFCTGPDERKAGNLAGNPHCVLTTGSNKLHEGLDLVVEGNAVRLTDDVRLRRVADAYVTKYGDDWRFDVRDGAFQHSGGPGGRALVFEVAPTTAFGFGKGRYSQTRWRFPR
jgi:hypothetical protein